MAEEQETKINNAVNGASEPKKKEQKFIIERIYVKDISFEAPNSPAVFKKDWEPDTKLNLNTQWNILGEDHYEIELHLNITVKGKDEAISFLVEVVQAGSFIIKGYTSDQLNHLLGSYCPSQLFPYAREVIASLVSKGSFPEMHLSPINFDALFAKNIAQQQKDAAAKKETKDA